MLTGKQNLGAESYERCNTRKFCCIDDNMDDYILNLRLAVLFSLSFFFFFSTPLQNASQILVFLPSFIICNCAWNHLSKKL